VELPSVSVITPCLNARATIEQTLESVSAQGYPQIEHVLVDGGSTDGTLEVLERAEGIRFVSEPDRGRPDAVNKGVAISSGEVIGFLNADDYYEPGAVDAVGEALARRPGAVWATGYCHIVDGAGAEMRRPVTAWKNLLLRRYSYGLYLTQNFVSDPATFVRRSALERVGPLDVSLKISHDYDLWLRVARLGDPVVLPRYLSNFRMVEGTLSMAGFERQFDEHRECARRHGDGHPLAVAANVAMSRLIVAVYGGLRRARRLRPA